MAGFEWAKPASYFVLLFSLCACSSGPVDPRSANTLEILFSPGPELFIEGLRDRKRVLSDRLSENSAELGRVQRDISDLRAEVTAQQVKNASQLRERALFLDEISNIEVSHNQLQLEQQSLRQQISLAEADVATARNELNSKNAELDEIEYQISSLEGKTEFMQDELGALINQRAQPPS